MWFHKLAEKYRFPEKGHDYDPNWDHEVDDKIEISIKNHVNQYVQKLNLNLLPKLKLFKSFQVEFVNSLSFDTIGLYVNGTVSCPMILLDIGNIEIACSEINCLTAIETTILHELGHAIQEAEGKPFDEDEAELFANEFWHYGKVMKI